MSVDTIPIDVRAALDAHPEAGSVFDNLPHSHRREYLTWVGEARKPLTRARRIEKMVERLTAVD